MLRYDFQVTHSRKTCKNRSQVALSVCVCVRLWTMFLPYKASWSEPLDKNSFMSLYLVSVCVCVCVCVYVFGWLNIPPGAEQFQKNSGFPSRVGKHCFTKSAQLSYVSIYSTVMNAKHCYSFTFHNLCSLHLCLLLFPSCLSSLSVCFLLKRIWIELQTFFGHFVEVMITTLTYHHHLRWSVVCFFYTSSSYTEQN